MSRSLAHASKIIDDLQEDEMLEKFGVEYYEQGVRAITGSKKNDLYTYKTYVGQHEIDLETGDCAYYMNGRVACIQAGSAKIKSSILATVIRGYSPPSRTTDIGNLTTLPYVNGCSTRQIFAPERIGDPTLQLLYMPPYSSEQVHHIHSTARVVHILEGKGRCVVGMDTWVGKQDLVPGMSLVLHPMCPHHFETESDSLLVLPLHVFSSAPAGMEFNHPMFNGTHKLS